MRTRFQQGLDELRSRLLRMGGLAEQAVDRASQAYIDRDLSRCQMVLEGETLINLAEREIDELAFDMLAMQQPMAVDLRFILAVTKINSDLERVGDQAVNIAERVMDLAELPKVDLPIDIPRMSSCGRRNGPSGARIFHRRQSRISSGGARDGQCRGPHERRSFHHLGESHE